MGCWNGSCLFSGMAILYTDEAVAFPMTSNYSSSALFPVHGKYNDYGSLEDCVETPLTRRILDLINENMASDGDLNRGHYVRKGEDYSSRVDSADEHRINSTDELMKALEREETCGDILKFYKNGREIKLHFVMVHGTIWRELKKAFLESSSFNYRLEREVTGQELLDNILNTLDKPDDDDFNFKLESITAQDIADDEKRERFIRRSKLRDVKTNIDEKIYLNRHCFCIGHEDVIPFGDIHEELLYNKDSEYVKSLRDALSDWFIFNHLCESLRRIPHRTASKGSQDDDHEMVDSLANAMKLAVSERKARYEE